MTRESRKNFSSEALSELEERDKAEREELERCLHSTEDDGSVSLPGRQSGDEEWRISRSEIGSDGNSFWSCSSCPVRTCVDEHVTAIYDAFSPVLSHFVENSISNSKAVEVLEVFRKILHDLEKLPYKTRELSINSASSGGQKIMHHLLPSSGQLLHSLSLKSEFAADGRLHICLVGDPVKTSLALPVALDALDDLIHDLNNCENFGEDSLFLPIMKSNRIHSGSVVASGEELPFGIVSSS